MATIVSKDQYFESALQILADDGFKGLNIGKLCKTRNVTSGSFYHHFGSWHGFVDALLEYWEGRQIVKLRGLGFGAAGPDADVVALRNLTLGLNHEAEAAIRAWGLNNAAVHDAQRRVDTIRRKTVQKAILRIIGDEERATVVTALGMAMLVGYQQLSSDGDHAELQGLLDEYMGLVFSHSNMARPI